MAVSNSTDRFNGVLASKAIKVPVKRATNVNQTLSGDPGAIDGWAWSEGDRILLYGQTNPVENGIWVVSITGAWSRAPDFDGTRDATESTLITAGRSGSLNPIMYVLTTDNEPIRIGTDALAFQIYFDPDNPAAAGLQAVTDVGNTTTNAIIINPLVANTEYLTIGNAGRIVLDNVFDTGDITIGYAASTFGQIDVNGVVDGFQFTGLDEFRVLGTGAPAGAVFVMGERNAISNPLPGPIASFGTLWIRDDTPNVLVFTDDAGTDWVLNQPAPTLQVVTDAGQTTTNNIELVNSNLLLDNSGEVQFGTAVGGEINIRYTEGNELEVYDASGTNTTFKVGAGINNILLNPEQNANAVLTIGEFSTLRGNAQQAILNMYGEDTGVLRLGQVQNTGALWWFNAPTLPIEFLGTDFVMDTVTATLKGTVVGGLGQAQRLSIKDDNNTTLGFLEHGTGAQLVLKNNVVDGNVAISGTNTGGTNQDFLEWSADNWARLSSPSGRDLFLRTLNTTAFVADNLGTVSLYYNGSEALRTVSKSTGGVLMAQSATGDGATFRPMLDVNYLGQDQEFWVHDYANFVMTDPTLARFKLNNADITLVTAIAVDDLTVSGRDFGGSLSAIQAGTQISMAQTTDLTRWAVFEATGPATDNGGWWEIPVEYVSNGAAFSTTTRLPFKFNFSNLASAPVTIVPPSTVDNDMLVWNNTAGEWQPSNGGVLWDGAGALRLQSSVTGTRYLEFNYDSELGINAIGGGSPTMRINDFGNWIYQDGVTVYYVHTNGSASLRMQATLNDFNMIGATTLNRVSIYPQLWSRVATQGAGLHVLENTSALAPTIAYGQYWVRDDVPNVPMFTDDAGNDWQLNNLGAQTTTITAGWSTGSGGSLTIAANAPLFYTEQANDDTPAAGQGQVWVRNDSPNVLMFTDDTGVDWQLTGAGGGITGTVADNQIVVGTGASSVDSSSELTYDAATGQLIHTHATTSLFQTGITAGVHTQITTQDNFTEIQFSDDSVDTSVARILFNINSASTGAHEYWFRDNDGTFMTIDCTNQQLTFAGRLGLVAQNDHGVNFASGEGQIWAKSRSLGDDLMFTADDYREDISLLSVMTHCYVFDNATAAADPGAGEFRLNNATPASVTQVYVNDADDGGRDAAYMLANLDVGDVITFRQSNNTAHYFTAQVSATPTDNTGWWTIPVTPIHTGTLFSLGNPSHLEVQWLSAAGLASGATTGSVLEWSGTAWVESTDLLLPANNPTFQSIANGDPTVPNNLDLELLFNSANNNYGQIGFNAGVNFEWINRAHGANMLIRGENASGTLIDGLEFDPDGPKVTVADSLFIPEQSAAQADVTAEGQLWVRDTAPNTLMFTDDTGVDYPVAGIAATQIKVKTAEETRTNNATFTNDTHLSGFALEAGAYYKLTLMFTYLHYQNPDMKWAINFSNVPDSTSSYYQAFWNFNNTFNNGGDISRSIQVSSSIVNNVDGIVCSLVITAHILANATTGGTVNFQWAQNTSDAQAITARKGSWMKIEKIG